MHNTLWHVLLRYVFQLYDIMSCSFLSALYLIDIKSIFDRGDVGWLYTKCINMNNKFGRNISVVLFIFLGQVRERAEVDLNGDILMAQIIIVTLTIMIFQR